MLQEFKQKGWVYNVNQKKKKDLKTTYALIPPSVKVSNR